MPDDRMGAGVSMKSTRIAGSAALSAWSIH